MRATKFTGTMTAGKNTVVLRTILEQRYSSLKERLTKRLGSKELAEDTLQDTWMRVATASDLNELKDPGSYLYRIALNIARDTIAKDKRLLTGAEIDQIFQVPDREGAEGVVDSRQQLLTLERALAELPPRCRQIFYLARLDRMSHAAIASKFGISPRMVLKELRRTMDHCETRLDRKFVQRFGPGNRNKS